MIDNYGLRYANGICIYLTETYIEERLGGGHTGGVESLVYLNDVAGATLSRHTHINVNELVYLKWC